MLNKAQTEVVRSDADKLLVLAGAGTGKTTTMLARISRLIEDNITNEQSILVLTFTNAAACEMRDRYRKNHLGMATPMFCTFHSFCYCLIARNKEIAKRIGYFKDTPSIADETMLHKISTACRQKCGTKLSEDKLNGKVPVTKKEQFDKDLYWKQYNKMLREQNLITFDIMCYEVCRLFTSDDVIVRQEKAKYKYIFVDEFQDTDPKQWDFVSSFTDSNIFVCGDAKQSIYSFRGADSSIIKSLAESEEWTTIKLSENYRSTMQICDYSNGIHKSWKGTAYDLDIISTKNGMEVIERSSLDIDSNKEIMSIIEDTSDGKTVAILCRTNYEVADIQEKLQSLGIAFSAKNDKKDTVNILKSAIDPDFLVDWLSNKLTSARYNDYLKLCAINDSYRTDESFCFLYGKYLTEYLKPIMQIRSILFEEDEMQFDCSFGHKNIISSLNVNDKWIRICSVLDIPVAEQAFCLAGDDSQHIINRLIEYVESMKTESLVYVGTIHSVKGLEYDCVHLIGVNGKSFHVDRNEDEMNLFYVGCTRAKEKLVIYDSKILN